ncbi:hypothetical protein [Neobacillus piezotolerans]|uniref:hypothetical protein n=1 Tax=Neobacillus piezotolerans TaxID=2259171 RepID=UPI0015F1AEBE|nr:hypothetical protein [Neobacillus piezotolerans]
MGQWDIIRVRRIFSMFLEALEEMLIRKGFNAIKGESAQMALKEYDEYKKRNSEMVEVNKNI